MCRFPKWVRQHQDVLVAGLAQARDFFQDEVRDAKSFRLSTSRESIWSTLSVVLPAVRSAT
jgi:hypothetical protein